MLRMDRLLAMAVLLANIGLLQRARAVDPCSETITPISTVQGEFQRSELEGIVRVRGVVTQSASSTFFMQVYRDQSLKFHAARIWGPGLC